MHGKEADSTGETVSTVASEAPARSVAGASPARLVHAARAGRLATYDAARLQRMVGNRSFARLVARAGDEYRPMQGAGPNDPKPDALLESPSGHKWVWDPFDHTVTIFMPPGQPNPGGAVQITYTEATPDANAKLKYMGVENVIGLSPVRAQVLEELRVKQGTYQEDENQRKARVAAGTGTLCYAFTSQVTSILESSAQSKTAKHLAGMNPRQEAIAAGRGGAFHTLEDRPEGPKPGDVVSYGFVKKKPTGAPRRRANFEERSHIGIFKSKRKSGDNWIWTVVDGGQALGKQRQAIWERTRLYTEEELDVQIPRSFAQADVMKDGHLQVQKGGVTHYETELVKKKCGVLKSSVADSGQNDDDKLLRGWMDIDEFYGSGSAESLSLAGVNSDVFVGSTQEARSKAASAGALAK
jgi:hypothetical protein